MRIRSVLIGGMAVAAVLAAPAPGAAQDGGRPAPVVELIGGWAGFLDDAIIHHGVVGVGGRVYLSPRVSVGPELVYMLGPDDDRDLFLTGNLTFDLFRPTADRRVTPFLVAGGGFMRHADRFGAEQFSSTEGAFTAGGGVRIRAGERVFLAGEVRTGWEPHLRVSGSVGITFGR